MKKDLFYRMLESSGIEASGETWDGKDGWLVGSLCQEHWAAHIYSITPPS